MSFESRIMAFSERFLSDRTVELIVAPALADLQFEHEAGGRRRVANRLAVLKAVTGGLHDQIVRDSGSFLVLTLLPAGYYIFRMILWFDFFSISFSASFFAVATLILVLSFGPVIVCFWPERRTPRPVD